MARFGRGDAPRVVGFDFGPAAPATPPAPEPAPVPAAPEPPAAEWPPPAPATSAPEVFAPSAAYPPPMQAAAYAPPAPPAFPPPMPYELPQQGAGWSPAMPPAMPAAPVGFAEAPYGGAPVAVAPPPPAPWSPTPAPMPVFQGLDPNVKVGAAKQPRDGIRREVTVIVVLLALVVGAGVVQRLGGGGEEPAPVAAQPKSKPFVMPKQMADLNAPASIGGEQRLNTRGGRALARELRKRYLPRAGRDTEIEFYGFELPRYAIFAGDLTKKRTAAAFYQEGVDGGMRLTAPRTFAKGLVCGRFADAGSGGGGMCVWRTSYYEGLVLTWGPVDLARFAQVTAKARADLERGT